MTGAHGQRDLVALPREDNVVTPGAAGFAELARAWEDRAARGANPLSWSMAGRAAAAGCAAIVVASFAVRATERGVVVVFRGWSTSRPRLVRVVDDEGRLPRDDRSWR